MRILWFTHLPTNDLEEYWGISIKGTGHWINALLSQLRECSAISQIGVVFAGTGISKEHVQIKGVDYFIVKQSKVAQITGICLNADEKRCLSEFQNIIEEFKPNIIHIHGTERFYGRLKIEDLTPVPTLISIQGIMGECVRYAWGDKSFFQVLALTNLWEISRAFPTLKRRYNFLKRSRQEKLMLNSVNRVIGRTDWDRSYCHDNAKNTVYHHVDEIMRPEFYGPRWLRAKANSYQIYTSGRITFLKGMHVFLETVALLKKDYPRLQVRIAGFLSGSPESRTLQRQVKAQGLSDTVSFLGWLLGGQVVQELLSAHCYVNTSFIENSSNALQEAMLLGCPCVTTFTGGMTTIMRHHSTGLMVPAGCATLAANAVREIFESDTLASSLGEAARTSALIRNDPKLILSQLISAYKKTCNNN
jgi:L-malate glycosyltransferase